MGSRPTTPSTRSRSEQCGARSCRHGARTTADLLLRQYDAVESLRQEAEKALVQEARKHPSFKILTTVPGLGGIRAARLMSVVVSPQRFRTREQFWKYAGFAVVKHSSADWEKNFNGTLYKHKTEQTRGLNRNHNHTLKDVFKGAATSIIAMHRADCPLFAHYTRMLDNKIKPALAQLTIARQIAAITLSLWKKEIAYDPAKLKKLT